MEKGEIMIGGKRCVVLLFVLVAGFIMQFWVHNAAAQIAEPGDVEKKFPWPTFLSAITGNNANGPVWGTKNYVCCSGGPFTFYLTGEGTTKKSTRDDCSTEGSWVKGG